MNEDLKQKHLDRAKDLFLSGYNCAQSVVGAYSDELAEIGVTPKAALRIASGFGGGIGRLRLTCGAVTGMVAVTGALYGYDDISNPENKDNIYAMIQKLTAQFKELHGSLDCHELLSGIESDTSPKASPRTDEYYETRPCMHIVLSAVKIIDENIERQEDKTK